MKTHWETHISYHMASVVLLLLLILLTACSVDAPEPVTWQNIFDAERGFKIAEISGQGYLLAEDNQVRKLDTEGNTLWVRSILEQLPGTGITRSGVVNFLVREDGGFVLSARGSDGRPDIEVWQLVEMNGAGNVVNFSTITIDRLLAVSNLTEVGNNFVMAAISGRPDSMKTLYRYDMDEAGNIREMLSLDVPGSAEFYTGGPLLMTRDGGMLAVYRRSNLPENEDRAWLAVRYDASLYEEWRLDFGETVFNELRAGMETPEGSYVLAGAYQGVYGWIVKIGREGQLVFDKKYETTSVGKSFLHGISGTIDGNYVLTGNTNRSSAGRTDAWVLKVDRNGNTIWNIRHGTQYYDLAWDVIATSDGGYALAGQQDTSLDIPDFRSWVLKLNSRGEL